MAVVEETAEALVGEVLDAVEDSLNPMSFLFLGAVAGLGVGIFAGFTIAKRLWQKKFDEVVEGELAQMREHYERRFALKQKEKPPVNELVAELGYSAEQAPVAAKTVLVEKPDEVEDDEIVDAEEVNAFETGNLTEWDYAEEMKTRTAIRPYIIHRDEHRENAKEYEEVTLTYFAGDDVLCDESDEVVDQEMVGITNLNKFGHGSGDGNVLFVCNDVIEKLFSVMKSDGTFAQEVHGFDPGEIKHSRRPHFDDE